MNLNAIFIGIPLILVAIAVIVAAITFAVKTFKGRSKSSKKKNSKNKKQSIFILLKALRAEKAELTKALWIRCQNSSYKPGTKLPKGTYQIDGLMRNDQGEWLISLIHDENSYLVKIIADSIKFTSKSKDETDDDDEDDDDDD